MAGQMSVREALGRAWDDGNAVGLDGWVGPGRGTEPIDREAETARERAVDHAIADIAEPRMMSQTDVDALPIGSVVMTVVERSGGVIERRVWQKFGGEPDWQFGVSRHEWQSTDGGFVRVGEPNEYIAHFVRHRLALVIFVPSEVSP